MMKKTNLISKSNTPKKSYIKKTSKSTKPKTTENKKPTINKGDFAVFQHLNNQFKVSVGEKIIIPYKDQIKEGEKMSFKQVLLTTKNIGNPYVSNFSVLAKCLKSEIKDKKIIVFKYKAKKNYSVKTGHRQKYTLIEITKFEDKNPKTTGETSANVK